MVVNFVGKGASLEASQGWGRKFFEGTHVAQWWGRKLSFMAGGAFGSSDSALALRSRERASLEGSLSLESSLIV